MILVHIPEVGEAEPPRSPFLEGIMAEKNEQDDQKRQAHTVPPRPQNIDQAVQAFEKNEQARAAAAKALSDEHERKQNQRRADAQRQLDKTKAPGPAIRMYGQDRFINTRESQDRPQRRKELSPEQRAMVEKLKEARVADRAELAKDYSDKKYTKLPDKPPPDRSR